MASEASVTVIGRSATLVGNLTGAGDVQIEGTLEGSVHLEGARITVGADASVRAVLSAQEIVVYGRVEGELRTAGRAVLRAHSTMIGDIFAARLAIEDDATLQGHVDCTPAAEGKAGTPEQQAAPFEQKPAPPARAGGGAEPPKPVGSPAPAAVGAKASTQART